MLTSSCFKAAALFGTNKVCVVTVMSRFYVVDRERRNGSPPKRLMTSIEIPDSINECYLSLPREYGRYYIGRDKVLSVDVAATEYLKNE